MIDETIKTEKLSMVTDYLSIPSELEFIRSQPNAFVHSYDYVYTDEGYPLQLAKFCKMFADDILKTKNTYLFASLHFLSPTQLNLKKEHDFGFPRDIKTRFVQRNINIENILIKAVFNKINHEEDKPKLLPYLANWYSPHTFLITSRNEISFTDEEIKSSLLLLKNRHNNNIDYNFNMPFLNYLCKEKKCEIFFAYGGIDFGSFIFYELKNS